MASVSLPIWTPDCPQTYVMGADGKPVRVCPRISCRHNLVLDRADMERFANGRWQVPEAEHHQDQWADRILRNARDGKACCVLDVVQDEGRWEHDDEGLRGPRGEVDGLSYAAIAELMGDGLTAERIRQITRDALVKVKAGMMALPGMDEEDLRVQEAATMWDAMTLYCGSQDTRCGDDEDE